MPLNGPRKPIKLKMTFNSSWKDFFNEDFEYGNGFTPKMADKAEINFFNINSPKTGRNKPRTVRELA